MNRFVSGDSQLTEWRIDELAQRAGVAVDTIRYYQREGLLPPGERSGRSMRFGPRHLERLERIRALQARRFSLAAIQALLDHDGGPTSLETMLAGRRGRVVRPRRAHRRRRRAGRARASGSSGSGFSAEPTELGLAAYDADDVDVLRSFADLRRLGVPDHVLFELARILNDGIESVQRQTAAVFHGELGPDWGPGVREQFESETTNESAARRARHAHDRRLRAAPQHPTHRAPRAR